MSGTGKAISPGDQGQRGFHILEVLVGLFILCLVVAAVSSYTRYNQAALKKSDSYYLSMQLASTCLEKAKQDLSDPDSLMTILQLANNKPYFVTKTETLQGKTFKVVLKYMKASSSGSLMKVRATVTWDGNMINTLGTAFPYSL